MSLESDIAEIRKWTGKLLDHFSDSQIENDWEEYSNTIQAHWLEIDSSVHDFVGWLFGRFLRNIKIGNRGSLNRMQEQVLEFHRAFQVPERSTPGFPSTERQRLRVELIREEFEDELQDAIASGTIVDVADALGDLLVVIFGTAIEFGLNMRPIVDEIHRSNMSKLGADGKPILRVDGKVLKGQNYSAPNLVKIVEEMK